MILLQPCATVEDLTDRQRLPSVDDLRPPSCPGCGAPARPPERLGIVGHGTRCRQVSGLVDAGRNLVIYVRRYLCRSCKRTTSVLPDALLPGRWYAGTAILVALVRTLLGGRSAARVRADLGVPSETPGWKTLERWQRQLLAPLWRWKAGEVGRQEAAPVAVRAQRRDLLRGLLALCGGHDRSPPDELARVAVALATNTAHTREKSWALGGNR